jgi:hypothetical protein
MDCNLPLKAQVRFEFVRDALYEVALVVDSVHGVTEMIANPGGLPR